MKYDSGIAYFMANELYYQGCPKITYVQLKDLTKLFKDEDLTGAKLAEGDERTNSRCGIFGFDSV